MNNLPEKIIIKHPETYEPREVDTERYIKAKTAQMKEFGYETLTAEHVENQLVKILNKEEITDVIGLFMENDIIVL